MLPRVKEAASPVELMLLNCSARCQMSYAGLVARCSGACRDLAWRCHLFIMLSSLGVERHAYAKQLAIRTQALSPDAMRRGPSLPGWTCTCRKFRNLSPPRRSDIAMVARYILGWPEKPEVLEIYPPSKTSFRVWAYTFPEYSAH